MKTTQDFHNENANAVFGLCVCAAGGGVPPSERDPDAHHPEDSGAIRFLLFRQNRRPIFIGNLGLFWVYFLFLAVSRINIFSEHILTTSVVLKSKCFARHVT